MTDRRTCKAGECPTPTAYPAWDLCHSHYKEMDEWCDAGEVALRRSCRAVGVRLPNADVIRVRLWDWRLQAHEALLKNGRLPSSYCRLPREWPGRGAKRAAAWREFVAKAETQGIDGFADAAHPALLRFEEHPAATSRLDAIDSRLARIEALMRAKEPQP